MKRAKSTGFGYTAAHAAKGKACDLPKIEAWDNQYRRDYEVKIVLDEFTSVCPKTGLPDFGIITIEYVPDRLCIELKSLKYYLLQYRNMGVFMENSVNMILDDVVKSVRPKRAVVTGEFTPRGGLRSIVAAKYRC